jgi:hypothetical protein
MKIDKWAERSAPANKRLHLAAAGVGSGQCDTSACGRRK